MGSGNHKAMALKGLGKRRWNIGNTSTLKRSYGVREGSFNPPSSIPSLEPPEGLHSFLMVFMGTFSWV